jgi:hypothetical protein
MTTPSHQPYGHGQQPPQPYGSVQMPTATAHLRYARANGSLGRIRPTGPTVLLFVLTLGIYGFVYFYKTHKEIQWHTGDGLGGPVALVLAIFAGFVSPFLLSSEVGTLYERTGRPKPVSARTGLWVLPSSATFLVAPYLPSLGWPTVTFVLVLLLAPSLVWFLRTNAALNEFWHGAGAR